MATNTTPSAHHYGDDHHHSQSSNLTMTHPNQVNHHNVEVQPAQQVNSQTMYSQNSVTHQLSKNETSSKRMYLHTPVCQINYSDDH